jgi:hypothetical protein
MSLDVMSGTIQVPISFLAKSPRRRPSTLARLRRTGHKFRSQPIRTNLPRQCVNRSWRTLGPDLVRGLLAEWIDLPFGVTRSTLSKSNLHSPFQCDGVLEDVLALVQEVFVNHLFTYARQLPEWLFRRAICSRMVTGPMKNDPGVRIPFISEVQGRDSAIGRRRQPGVIIGVDIKVRDRLHPLSDFDSLPLIEAMIMWLIFPRTESISLQYRSSSSRPWDSSDAESRCRSHSIVHSFL